MMADHAKLMLILHSPPFKVSSLSSLFISLQAAVRKTATDGYPVDMLFSNQRGPFLVTELESCGDGSLMLSLWFVDRNDVPMTGRSEEMFERAMTELERTVLSGSQHSFWGASAYQWDLRKYDSRMLRFVTVLRAFRSATISYRGRSLILRDGLFALERS